MITQKSWQDAQHLWAYHQMGHTVRPCSVAIGLGSHDLGVADTTATLYRDGMAPVIVFTGATSQTTCERMPRGEAEHYRERAVELGVPAHAIFVEPNARNTGENIKFSRALLSDQGIAVSSALLVRKPYEERRAIRHGVQDVARCGVGLRFRAHELRGIH